MPRPRPLNVTTLIALFVAMILSACASVIETPLFLGDFACEEMQGESLRALLGADASSLSALRSEILAQFPDAVPMLYGEPLDGTSRSAPRFDFTVQWAAPSREYIAFINDHSIDSVLLAPASGYAGPTMQEATECLGAPPEYFAQRTATPDGPQNGIDLRLLYTEDSKAVYGYRWDNSFGEDGQLTDPAITSKISVVRFVYYLPQTRDDLVGRVFAMRDSDWEARTPLELEERQAFRDRVLETIRPWPESWDEIRIQPMGWQE